MGQTVLRDFIENVRAYHWSHIVFIDGDAPSWSLDTAIAFMQRDGETMPEGMQQFLSVGDLQGIVDAWIDFRDGRKPTPEQALRAIRYYCEHDAFIPESAEP